jgi:hypothetical protein
MPPPYKLESPVQRFRDAVRAAANNLVNETGICPASVQMSWRETKTGSGYIQSITVGFAEDKLDGYEVIMPYYSTDGGEPPQL